MAIDRTGISSLQSGAPEIKYTGDVGPKSPDQQLMAQADPMLVEMYEQYVFEMEEQGMQPMSFREFVQQAMSGMATGGRAGYKDGEMVTVPKHWQSAPDHPKTELAYITKAEKDLLVKKDLHNSLKDGPNVGPGGVMSLNGDFGIGESYGDRQVSDRSPEVGDIGGGYQDPGYKERRKAREKDPYYGTEHEGKGLVPTTSVIETPTGVKTKDEDLQKEYKQTLGQKWNQIASNQRKKALLRNMVYYAKGKPIAPPLMQMLQGGMTEEEFEKEFGISISDIANLSPTNTLDIKGLESISQIDSNRLRDMAKVYGQDYVSQDDWTKAFYGPKGPPDLTGGGDGPQPIIYPYQIASASASAPGTDTPTDVAPITGFPTDRIRFASSQPSAHDFTGIYGQRTIPVKDGGRIGYAGGGIADLRQGYFLGKLVKKITRPIKKVLKSPIGKMALLGLGGYYLGGGQGLWGKKMFGDKFGTKFALDNLMKRKGIQQLFTKKGEGTEWDPWKLGIGAISMYPLVAGMGDDDDKNFEDTDLYKKWLAQKQGWDQTFAPVGDPANFQRMRLYSADGGRIGYDSGGDVMMASAPSLEDSLNDMSLNIFKKPYHKLTDEEKEILHEINMDLVAKPQGIQMAAQGGRIGYAEGGNDDEEDHRSAALSAMYGLRKNAQEGGLMDMGGMEKDYRNEGGFVPIGGQERADDVPARLSKNEFVFTADAVRNAGGGDIDKGAEIMENLMENLENGGKVSEDSQGLEGARDMFATSQRLEGVL